jgi:hypothetical protein
MTIYLNAWGNIHVLLFLAVLFHLKNQGFLWVALLGKGKKGQEEVLERINFAKQTTQSSIKKDLQVKPIDQALWGVNLIHK